MSAVSLFKFLLLMPRAVTGWFCENEVSAVLLFYFSPVRQMSSRLFFCNSLRFLLFSWSGTVASGREGSAAEPDVAWLASEAMATLCAERLKPLRQRSDSHEQPCAKTCRSVL